MNISLESFIKISQIEKKECVVFRWHILRVLTQRFFVTFCWRHSRKKERGEEKISGPVDRVDLFVRFRRGI